MLPEKISCIECGNKNTLDSMIRHEVKGVYHCIDCEVEHTNKEYMFNTTKNPVRTKKLTKMLQWCFGLIFCFMLLMSFCFGAVEDDINSKIDKYLNLDENSGTTISSTGDFVYDISGLTFSWNTTDNYLGLSAISLLHDQEFRPNSLYSGHKAFCLWFTNFTVSDGNLYVIGGLGSNHNAYVRITDSDISYYDGSYTLVKNINRDVDFLYCINNIDYANNLYDISYQGVNQSSSLPMQTASSGYNNQLYLNKDGNGRVIFDEIIYFNQTLTNEEILYLNSTSQQYPYIAQVRPNVSIIYPTSGNYNNVFNISYNLTGSTPIDCEFFINGTSKDYTTNLSIGNHTFNFSGSVALQGYNEINITCNNSEGYYSSNVTIFFDSIDPIIIQAKNKQLSDNIIFDIDGSTIDENLNLEINVSDNNLYSFNISICHNDTGGINFSSCEYKDKSIDITSTLYVYNQSINIGSFSDEGTHAFYIEVCDGHTSKYIPDLTTSFNDGKLNIEQIKITPITSSINVMNTVKYDDRVSFSFSSDKPESLIIFDVESLEKIYYRERSIFQGHFVSGKYWIDFENDFYNIESVQKLSDFKYRVSLRSEIAKSFTEFRSVGLINCINTTLFSFIDSGGNNVTIHSPKISYDVNNAKINITINYTPFYNPATPENCSLLLNGSFTDIDLSVTKNVINSFIYEFPSPLEQQRNYYNVSVYCEDYHLHPPIYYENDLTSSITLNFSIFNTATSTTVSTTTTTTLEVLQISQDDNLSEFQTLPQASFYIFMVALWLIMVVLTLKVTGNNGRTIQIFNLMQIILGMVAGTGFMKFSYLIGIMIIGVSVVVGAGKFFE